MFNATNNFNNSYLQAAVDENETLANQRTTTSKAAPATKSKITITKIVPEETIERPTKRNKRSLCDTSNNQTFLNESEIRAEIGMKSVQVPESEDEDDVLLTQALNRQEQMSQSKKDSQTPPAKKQKSLIQSLFEDGDDGNESSSSDFMVIANNNASAKKISFATLCQNSQSDDSSDEDGNNTTYKEKNPVYVADSDSE